MTIDQCTTRPQSLLLDTRLWNTLNLCQLKWVWSKIVCAFSVQKDRLSTKILGMPLSSTVHGLRVIVIVCVHLCVNMCVCMRLCVCMHVCVYVCVYVYVCVC